ncbi:hypothetical protein [Streptomyces boninensis]|uniref:hypothetical protein n=1 Tax=Streptomyces boninensis TaxID=2039455 RepID=UPI003B2121CE
MIKRRTVIRKVAIGLGAGAIALGALAAAVPGDPIWGKSSSAAAPKDPIWAHQGATQDDPIWAAPASAGTLDDPIWG